MHRPEDATWERYQIHVMAELQRVSKAIEDAKRDFTESHEKINASVQQIHLHLTTHVTETKTRLAITSSGWAILTSGIVVLAVEFLKKFL